MSAINMEKIELDIFKDIYGVHFYFEFWFIDKTFQVKHLMIDMCWMGACFIYSNLNGYSGLLLLQISYVSYIYIYDNNS